MQNEKWITTQLENFKNDILYSFCCLYKNKNEEIKRNKLRSIILTQRLENLDGPFKETFLKGYIHNNYLEAAH